MESGNKNKLVIRLLMIGDSSVGKTSLVIRYDEDSFSTKYMTTIGVDYRDKFVTVDGRPIKLQIWDTAGQERFRSLTANFFGKADGFVVCFDVASRASFAQVRNWVHDVQTHKRGEVDVCLCGCKCDVPASRRQVAERQGQALADEYGVPYFETSAKENLNVSTCFEDLAHRVVRRKLAQGVIPPVGAPKNDTVRVDDQADGGALRRNCSC